MYAVIAVAQSRRANKRSVETEQFAIEAAKPRAMLVGGVGTIPQIYLAQRVAIWNEGGSDLAVTRIDITVFPFVFIDVPGDVGRRQIRHGQGRRQGAGENRDREDRNQVEPGRREKRGFQILEVATEAGREVTRHALTVSSFCCA
ncbi:hypothetical protein [Microbacterium sp. LWH10-1.2]|uniref:hypothetical protein n=1 Tax=Microbacterium sp. LWH10-1.2 TaxID=3135255 RepID=UPI00313A39F0